MFGLRKREESPVSAQALKKPIPTLVVPGAAPLGAYELLADELDFQPAQLLEEQLLRFLVAECIPIYDYAQVDAYMATLAEVEGKTWIWRPLREKDKPQGWMWTGRQTDVVNDPWRGHGGYRNEWDYRPYNKAVPIHILRQVKKIQDKFGDKVLFFVSDYVSPNPDPFIMVTALDVGKIVFGVWDEPGFGAE